MKTHSYFFLLFLITTSIFSGCGVSSKGSGTTRPVVVKVSEETGQSVQGGVVTLLAELSDTTIFESTGTLTQSGEVTLELPEERVLRTTLIVTFETSESQLELEPSQLETVEVVEVSLDRQSGSLVLTEEGGSAQSFTPLPQVTQTPSQEERPPESPTTQPTKRPTRTPLVDDNNDNFEVDAEKEDHIEGEEQSKVEPIPTEVPTIPVPPIVPTVSPTLVPPVLDSNEHLRLYYTFEENLLPSILDISSKGNHGVVSGGVGLRQSRFGTSVSFDGIDGVVDIPHFPMASNQITISFWVRPGQNEDEARILSKADGHRNKSHDYMFAIDSGALAVRLGTATRLYRRLSEAPLPEHKWTHIALVVGSDSSTIYHNGTQVTLIKKGGLSLLDGRNIALGNQPSGLSLRRPFQGEIDELRIYDIALTESDIKSIFNNP